MRLPSALARAAGSERSHAANRQLAMLLALVAGVLNSVGFVAVSLYTSHMTGLVASTADNVSGRSWAVAGLDATAVASFLVGAATCAIVFNWGRRRHREARYANVLGLQAILVLTIAVTADHLRWHHRAWVIVPVLCFTMGLQNAIITKISSAQIRTTHVTGMVTDIGIELGKLLYRSRTPGLLPVLPDLPKLRMLTELVGLFFVGGVLGSASYVAFGFATLLAPALLLILVAVPPVLIDRSSRRSTAA